VDYVPSALMQAHRAAGHLCFCHSHSIGARCRCHVVAVSLDLCDEPVQTFQAFNSDLQRVAEWLAATGINTVGIESTGLIGSPPTKFWRRVAWKSLLPMRGKPCGARQEECSQRCTLTAATARLRTAAGQLRPRPRDYRIAGLLVGVQVAY
jgi:hypothetical protein